MNEIFLKIIESSILASFFILAVVVIRQVFSKKVPKWIICLVWALMGIRLLVPITIESDFSIVPKFSVEYEKRVETSYEVSVDTSDTASSSNMEDSSSFDQSEEREQIGAGIIGTISQDSSHENEPPIFEGETEEKSDNVIFFPETALTVCSIIWMAVTLGMLIYGAVKYIILKRRVSVFSLYKDGARKCEAIDSPFVLGVIKPRIYLPFDLSEKSEKYIIAHEKSHIKRLDHISKIIAFIVLSVHWFNPLVWLSFNLFCIDVEYACDEKVLKTLDAEEKKDYATALLECSTKGSRIVAYPVAFGEVGVKQRVKNAISYKKPLIWIIVISIMVCAILPVIFLTSPKNDGENTDKSNDDSSMEDEVLDEKLEKLRRAREGDVITFGEYEQDDISSNGKEEIKWVVIEESGTKIQVMSLDALDCVPYNDEQINVNWESCTLRKWLNNDFLNTAFSDYEKSLIPISDYDTDDSGNAIQDKIFLLSVAEANSQLNYDFLLSCNASKYAQKKLGKLKCRWWLRGSEEESEYAPCVHNIVMEATFYVFKKDVCVRPVMWIDLSSLLNIDENDDSNNIITPEEAEKLRTAKIGDYVFFGKYEQDNVLSNGREEIEWQVLATEGCKTLLISKYSIDTLKYSNKGGWISNTLSKWLEVDFYNSAFSESERKLISENKRVVSDKFVVTTFSDKVWVLFRDDANRYFKLNKGVCEPTAYAVSRGISVDDNGKVSWWLHSDQDKTSQGAFIINQEGEIKNVSPNSEGVGVRPAIWVDWSSLFIPEISDASNQDTSK